MAHSLTWLERLTHNKDDSGSNPDGPISIKMIKLNKISLIERLRLLFIQNQYMITPYNASVFVLIRYKRINDKIYFLEERFLRKVPDIK